MSNINSPQTTSSGFVVVSTFSQGKRPRGLPERADLLVLATTYLAQQTLHWPGLAGGKLLPEQDQESLARLANEFEASYASGQLGSPIAPATLGSDSPELGAAYIRYSDANSNTRSLDQQLINVLQIARREQVFIPWNRVFADAAISGTTVNRSGYQMLRELVQSDQSQITRLFVDDLDRLNREQIESLRFLQLVNANNMRLTTANGFDSSQQMSKLTHAFKAIQNELFVDQLKEKVIRGMKDEHAQGQNLGLPPTGFKVVPKRDASGVPILDRNGKCETEVVIDEEAAAVVRRIFSMYVNEKKSPGDIARTLSQENALDRNRWYATTIHRMLKNDRYIGVYVWGKHRTTKNPETGKRQDVMRQESEHLRREDPHLRIIDDELWKAVQKRRAEMSRDTRPKGAKKSRQACYPTRLFDLYCGYCHKPLWLSRSGKYSHLQCLHGKGGSTNCELRTSKSISIIDDCILHFIKTQVLDEAIVDGLLLKANTFLVEEAAKPTTDTAELIAKIQAEEHTIKRLAERLAVLGDGIAADTLLQSTVTAQGKLEKLRVELEIASAVNFRPEPIGREEFISLLRDLRELLKDDVVASHEVLATALGRVNITQGPKAKRGHTWIAELDINPAPVFLEIAKNKNCPSSGSLDYLQIRSWTNKNPITVKIDQRGEYQQISSDPKASSPNTPPSG
ncbi:recombinase family protein [Rhodopirellula europaea]|uniref:Recombinase n=1 Tax=Rhodopirellula europaea SH398 TaxID=1263868 RepID=M5RZH5_9BACT|nr:recombinase family protein [Rhodopirellula europaea]EMI24626.1 recombinase [Rhodopirellula europaea SH398]